MFVLHFSRFMQRYRTQQLQNSILVTSEAAPLLQGTENSLSTRAIAREEGNTYVSYPNDMSSELGSIH